MSTPPAKCSLFKVTTPKFRSHPSGLSRNLLGHNLTFRFYSKQKINTIKILSVLIKYLNVLCRCNTFNSNEEYKLINYKIVNGAIEYGSDTIIEEINFEIKDKEKIAVVGNNGCGKTSLLKAIVDNSLLSEGIGEAKFNVYKQGNPEIGYLRQVEFENSGKTFLEEILLSYKNITDIEDKINKLQEKLQNNHNEKLIKEYTQILETYEFIGGYTYKNEYEAAIKNFGFSEQDKNKKISEFSGGQKTKIAFLKLLLGKPDILLLDEPTNHLDITAIEWLENYLKNYPNALVIVSHDRTFLDKIVNKVYEIEYASINAYKGNYEAFVKQKRQNYEKQLKDYEYQQKEIKRLQKIADRFRFKPSKAKMAISKLKKIEQMTIIEQPNPYDLRTFHSNFSIKQKSGNLVLSVKDLEIGYDNKPLSKVSFELYKGQKLAVIGENGKGKSTLLKTLMGKIPKISGNFEYGYNVEKDYFDQQMELLNFDNDVYKEFSNDFPNLNDTQARTVLGMFLFTGDDVFKEIKVLSGGEKVRLQLCKILKRGANLLLLDEPTNHLDILGKDNLENILKKYEGTLIFVSHDRYFVNTLADSILAFEKDKVVHFNGTYEEYCRYKETKITDNDNIEKVPEKNIKTSENQYLKNKENAKKKNKIKKLENEIDQQEKELQKLKAQMENSNISTDYIKLKEIQDNITKLEQDIEQKMTQWEELSIEIF